MTRVRFGLLLLGLAFGCAEPPEAPPAEGTRCETDADCRSSGSGAPGCGFYPLCIAGRCALTATAPATDRCEPLDDAGDERD